MQRAKQDVRRLSSRSAPETKTASSPGTARRWASSRCAGPWVAAAYYNRDDCGDRFTDDGWFKTGDIVTIDERATVSIQDRDKDLIKSGGEWISSVALESALMGHPAVAEAAVIPVASSKWIERPLAAVVLKPGQRQRPPICARSSRRSSQVLAAGRVRVHRRNPADVCRKSSRSRLSARASRTIRSPDGTADEPLAKKA